LPAGAVKYLLEHYDLKGVQFVGASAGALVATLGACGIIPEVAVDCAYRSAPSKPRKLKVWYAAKTEITEGTVMSVENRC
jgi:hypothetical protein